MGLLSKSNHTVNSVDLTPFLPSQFLTALFVQCVSFCHFIIEANVLLSGAPQRVHPN
jgi:hypothetical protein